MTAEKITVPAGGRQLDVLAIGPRDALTIVLHMLVNLEATIETFVTISSAS